MEKKDNLKVGLVQTDLYWEDKIKNINKFNQIIDSIDQTYDLILLPEMFTTGFSMNAQQFAEVENAYTLDWLREKSKGLKAMIMGSVMIKEAGNYYNRLLAVMPDGAYYSYDKRHLFRIVGESDVYTSGKNRLIIEYLGWRISPFICYDLRFPVWSRNKNDYDLYINVANWPGSRREIWMDLLKARAIENQVYVLGVNRIGEDYKGTAHSGDSMIIDPKGIVISLAEKNEDVIISAEIILSELQNFRKNFPAYLDADDFELMTD